MTRWLLTLVLLLGLSSPALADNLAHYEVVLQNAAAATGNGSSISVESYSTVTMQVSGTFVGTVTFEGSIDGTNAVSLTCVSLADQAGDKVSNVTTTGIWQCNVAGLTSVRARVSAYTSGNITVLARASTAPFQYGAARTPQKSTYSASLTAKTATAAGTGPWFALCGSSTKTLRVQKLSATVTVATAAVYADLILEKTSTATSAGTPVALTALPHDSNSAAATANLVNYYSALATTGTVTGTLESRMVFAPLTGTPAVYVHPTIFEWTRLDTEGVVLRGTGQCLQARFGTTTTNAPTIAVNVVWTEE